VVAASVGSAVFGRRARAVATNATKRATTMAETMALRFTGVTGVNSRAG
jgi:hypothetical protein